MYPRTLSISQQIALRNRNTPTISPSPVIPQTPNVVIPQTCHSENNQRVLGSHSVNTHFFDGKLPSFTSSLIDDKVAREIESDISRAALISKEDKIQYFHKLEEKVRSYTLTKKGNIPPHSTRHLRLIISTHERCGKLATSSNGNYDPANKLHACDLLYLLYEKIMSEEEPEYMRLMLEQLDEMVTGSCAIGRCCRLFQALVMLRDDLTPTSKPVE